jgi:serine/threonine-protein kinase TNNI3K
MLLDIDKIENYMMKKGIKLTFLIPKDQIEIIKPIGKGGYGQVYLGRWLGQDVAVKKYMKKEGFRNRHVGHFIEEVQVINKLLHPCIVLYMGNLLVI